MPLIQTGSYMVCIDCYVLILTGDASHLDYYYDEKEADKRLDEIKKGMRKLSDQGTMHDGETRDEFSHWRCECCGSHDAGERREITTFANAID